MSRLLLLKWTNGMMVKSSYRSISTMSNVRFIRVSILPGEFGEKFMRRAPVKCANADVADCDSHILDASELWYGYSCLPQSHWKCALAETGKTREFPVSNF